jgi:hypothetical protein
MKILRWVFCLVVIVASCDTARDPASVKAKLLADEDFKNYIVAQKAKMSSPISNEDAEKTSFKYYQKLYKNYISKNLLTTQELNAIIKERIDEEMAGAIE